MLGVQASEHISAVCELSYGPEPGVLCDKENVRVSDDANEEILRSPSITWVLGKPARELKHIPWVRAHPLMQPDVPFVRLNMEILHLKRCI